MEILLAVVVASAVIFFGALISMGNERQRRAIDGLREQVILWAMQDLKIKREHLAQTVQVPDPLGWLNQTASKVCGNKVDLQLVEIAEHLDTLICASTNGDARYIFTTLAPNEIRVVQTMKRNRISQDATSNPILFLPRNTKPHECSTLNCGMFFDLELDLVWKQLANTSAGKNDRLWLYILS